MYSSWSTSTTYMYVHVMTYIHVYTHIHVHTYRLIRRYIWVYICNMYIYIYVHTYIYTHICLFHFQCFHIFKWICINFFVYVNTCIMHMWLIKYQYRTPYYQYWFPNRIEMKLLVLHCTVFIYMPHPLIDQALSGMINYV